MLLDHQAPASLLGRVREAIEGSGEDRVADLHVWSIGPGLNAACLSVVSSEPRAPDAYKGRIPADLGLAHLTVEVHACGQPPRPPPREA